MQDEGDRNNPSRKRPIRQWAVLGTAASALLWAEIAASGAQELPRGGGPVPDVRRGANGQIELVAPDAGARPKPAPHSAAPVAAAPKPPAPASNRDNPSPVLRHAAPAPGSPVQPVITVRPSTPRVPDTIPRGAIVATYSVEMSDGSPFTGTVRFGPPYFDGKGVFALSGDQIIVNPNGPGLGPGKATFTNHVTLEAIP